MKQAAEANLHHLFLKRTPLQYNQHKKLPTKTFKKNSAFLNAAINKVKNS